MSRWREILSSRLERIRRKKRSRLIVKFSSFSPNRLFTACVGAIMLMQCVPVDKVSEKALTLYSKEIDASQAERLGRSCLSIVPRSRSHARLRQNATMSHTYSKGHGGALRRVLQTDIKLNTEIALGLNGFRGARPCGSARAFA
ncbi:hypothetical protein EVAR_42541_1 [Eumeta japonica]|uniref:Uncharacterized protein n=1 Tax=Eumeta variegata TaxID=151549 RepID=A0A4C1WS78_EUMVA|nr:hypothetical protein EVAR_42541_1 [Eumeta japonica]